MTNLYKSLLLLLTTLFCLNSFASLQIASSQLPPNFTKGTLPIPNGVSAISDIRVKIFPHTLRNDWRHGRADNKKLFKMISPTPIRLTGANGNFLDITSAQIEFKNSQIYIGKTSRLKSPITFSTQTPVLIERKGNESKSSSYTGSFKLKSNKSGLELINTVDMQTYLRGVVPSESSSEWPLEALKAQALAARTYALYHLINSNSSKDWDVDDTARYQVYSGVAHRADSTDQAVDETNGEVITYNGEVIVAFFHAYSGGWTDTAKNIFKTDLAPYCDVSQEVFQREELKAELPQKSHWVVEWTKKWNKEDLMRKAFNNFKSLISVSIEVTEFNEFFNTAKTIVFSKLGSSSEINFLDLRKNVGWTKFNSYHFNVEDQTQDSITLRGYGWGHHVWMSQWGAFMMAKHHQATYQDIIKHYYHDVEITKI